MNIRRIHRQVGWVLAALLAVGAGIVAVADEPEPVETLQPRKSLAPDPPRKKPEAKRGPLQGKRLCGTPLADCKCSCGGRDVLQQHVVNGQAHQDVRCYLCDASIKDGKFFWCPVQKRMIAPL